MTYDARRKELTEQLGALNLPDDLPGDQRARYLATESPAFVRGIDAWHSDRERFLAELVRLVEDTSADKVQVQAWTEHVERAIERYASSLGGALQSTGGVPSLPAIAWQGQTTLAERAFFEAVKRARTAAACRDYIARYKVSVEQKVKALEVRWIELRAKHGDFDRKQQEIHAELMKLLDEAAARAVAEHAPLQVKAVQWVLIAKEAPIPGEKWEKLKVVIDAIALYGQSWLDLEAKAREYRMRYQEAFQRETSVTLVLYEEFREETEEFVREYSYEPHLTETLDDARDALAALTGASELTPGQKTDAEELARAVLAALEKHAAEARKVWDDFVKANHGIFFGPVTPDTVEKLLDIGAWRERGRPFIDKHQTLARLLATWLDQARNFFFVSLDELPREQIDEIRRRYHDEVDDIARKAEAVQRDLEALMTEKLEQPRQEALDALDLD